jgi:hypothetical protein
VKSGITLETLMTIVTATNSHLKPEDLRDWLLERGFAVERDGELIPTSRTVELVGALRPTSTAAPRIRSMDEDANAQLIAYARIAVGAEHGLDPVASRRLVGADVEALHRDAAAMATELGIVDPTKQPRDGGGRYAGGDMNRIIRERSGRT